jgi:cytochrome P450
MTVGSCMAVPVKIQDFDDGSYDPFISDEVMFGNVNDPYAQIARWRAKGPVMRGSFREMLGVGQLKSETPETYMVMSAEEIATVLTDTTGSATPVTAHFAFARGPHMCLGQHLARLETSRAINALLDRLSGLRLDPNRPPAQILGCYMRVPRHLYVRFGE